MEALLEFRYEPQPADFARAIRHFYARQWFTRLFGVLAVLLALVAWLLALQGADMVTPAAALTLTALFFLVILFVWVPTMTARRVARSERARAPLTWQVTPERITITTPHAASSFDWGTFSRLIETPDAFLLLYTANKQMFQVVPKRAFGSPEASATFVRMAQSALGSAAVSLRRS